MPLADILLGSPLASSDEKSQRVGPARGVPIFGLDALSSAAYGPEAALTILLPLGVAGLTYILPLTTGIVVLLAIVYFSYRQTIAAYPQGAGSYTVAKENLGEGAGLLAAAALLIDYLLNVAVAISAGVGALVSGVPKLQPYTLTLCLVILVLITIANLRGIREPGALFMAPTYLFVACLFVVILWGLWRSLLSGGHPQPLVPPPPFQTAQAAASTWIVLKAFASGCTAMTGVEAVSNGVQAFREPVVKSARLTLTVIISILILLLLGIAELARTYHIGATDPGQPGYQSVLSQLTEAVAGRGVFYGITIAAILSVLCLSANTSFADFPRVCRAVAMDSYLPRSLTNRGRRLVYSEGIWILAILSAGVLILFGGVTDRLIPLFAVGAFLAFTMSQAGMVAHWKKAGGRGARGSMLINGIGAIATGATLAIILAAKFTSGAWVVVLLVPAILAAMAATRHHYARVDRETAPRGRLLAGPVQPPIAVVPMEQWNSTTQKALRFAFGISNDIEIVHVDYEGCEPLQRNWAHEVEHAAQNSGVPMPRIVRLSSPYRFVIQPIIDHILALEKKHAEREIAVVIPMLVEPRWYQYFLHSERNELLSGLLLLKGDRRISIVNVPWYIK
ncbi:MAG: APC family permease [Bryobacterales bacterium]|nr:APC family permease [Bryobacterales bacterium]MBV9399074.1 APC family permease [Bryobacterales bacterium]